MNANDKTGFSLGFVFLTVIFTVYGQLIVKWRVRRAGTLPADFMKKLYFLAALVFDPWILSGLIAAFVAGLFWMSAMTRLELSYAYPFMSLAFVFVLILSVTL